MKASLTNPPVSNRRSLDRFSVKYIAQIQALDGWRLTKKVDVTDLSEDGARIHARWELPVGAVVRLRIPKIKSAVTGCVRTCVKREFGYDIGLEFRGNLYRTAI